MEKRAGWRISAVAPGVAALGGLFRLATGLPEEFETGAAIRCEGVYWFPPRFTDGLANGIGYDSPEALREEAQEKQDK